MAFLTTFDAPGGELNCERRMSSTAAPQALMLMNNEFILQEAGHLAQRLRKERPMGLAQQLAHAWQLAYQRPATAAERAWRPKGPRPP